MKNEIYRASSVLRGIDGVEAKLLERFASEKCPARAAEVARSLLRLKAIRIDACRLLRLPT
jgi:hypothetical protein